MSLFTKEPLQSGEELIKQVLRHEMIGFGVFVAILMLDDLLDLMNIFPRGTLAGWWVVEITAALTVVAYTIRQTRALARKIKFLEGLLSICMFCKKIRQAGQWIALEEYISGHSAVEFSHGICPECLTTHYGIHKEENGVAMEFI